MRKQFLDLALILNHGSFVHYHVICEFMRHSHKSEFGLPFVLCEEILKSLDVLISCPFQVAFEANSWVALYQNDLGFRKTAF